MNQSCSVKLYLALLRLVVPYLLIILCLKTTMTNGSYLKKSD